MRGPVDSGTLEVLAAKIADIENLQDNYDESARDRWHTETKLLLEHIFGEKSDKVETFSRYDGSLSFFWSGETDDEMARRGREAYFSDLKAARNFLQGLYDFLQKISKTSEEWQAQSMTNAEREIPSNDHTFHPVIAQVSGPLFRDGHYRDAIRAALIEVIDRVKEKTGRRLVRNGKGELDGDDLMNQAFAQEHGEPMLSWNERKTSAEKDFQTGMFYLFKGMVALRNEKGHVNVEQKDKEKAFEYLCLASLLLRQLDDSRARPIKDSL